MKHPFINHRRILSGENNLPGVNLIQARNRLTGFQRLPCRVASRAFPSPPAGGRRQKLQARRAIFAAEAIMVRCPFIAKQRHLRQGRMDGKTLFIGEDRAQQRFGRWRFAGAVEFIVQIGHGQVNPAIQRIGRGETVAALATHIDEAELTADSRSGA